MTVKEYNRAVDDHSDGVYRFIIKSIGDADLAADIVQDSYERLWLNVAQVDFSRVRSWLFSTAYNRMIDIIRRDAKMVSASEFPEEESVHDTQYSDLAELLNRLVEKLPEKQRSVIMLRDYEGYSYREISEITGLPEAQVKINIYRGRTELRRIIGKIEAVV